MLNSRIKMTEDGPFIVALHDFSNLLTVKYSDEPYGPEFVNNTIKSEHLTPLDIHTGRPVYVSIVLTDDQRGVLSILLHHIAVDAWSVNLVVNDLNFFYEQALAGLESETRKEVPSFFEYAHSTRKWHDSDQAKPFLEYWSGAIEDPQKYKNLNKRNSGDRLDLFYDEIVSNPTRPRFRKGSYFPAVPFMAAYGKLISNVLNLSNVIIHFPFSARSLGPYDETVGTCISNIFVELRDIELMTNSELLDHVQAELILAIEHGELQQNMLRLRGVLPSHSIPIFGFNYLSFPNRRNSNFVGTAIEISSKRLNQDTFAINALQLFIAPNGRNYNLRWGFSNGFFTDDEVRWVQKEFKVILEKLDVL